MAPDRDKDILGFARRASRPLVDLSLALNYRLAEKHPPGKRPPDSWEPWGYHFFNLTVHLIAGLALFGVVRRTIPLCGLSEQTTTAAAYLAFAVALIWVVHPLQTQSVTYIIQRCESMMGMFFLLTAYFLLRAVAPDGIRWRWAMAAWTACAAGMLSKGVMVTAPPVLLLFDLAVLRRTMGPTRTRWLLHAGFALTLVFLVTSGVTRSLDPAYKGTATVGLALTNPQNPFHTTPLAYLNAQPAVILRYLRQSFWPTGQMIYYGRHLIDSWSHDLTPKIIIPALLIVAAVSWRRKPWIGFLGMWFFLILAPTSSIIPIRDRIYEHRMYLPLAAVIVLVIAALVIALRRSARIRNLPGIRFGMLVAALTMAPAVALGITTHERNKVYVSREALWSDVLSKDPNNARALNNYGRVFLDRATPNSPELATATECFKKAVLIDPKSLESQYNLGNAYSRAGRNAEAVVEYQKALVINRGYAEAGIMLGNALSELGRMTEAEAAFRAAIRHARPKIDPRILAKSHFNLGNTLLNLNRLEEARDAYADAVRLNGQHTMAWYGLGLTREQTGDSFGAADAYRHAVAADPGNLKAAVALKRLTQSTSGTSPARTVP